MALCDRLEVALIRAYSAWALSSCQCGARRQSRVRPSVYRFLIDTDNRVGCSLVVLQWPATLRRASIVLRALSPALLAGRKAACARALAALSAASSAGTEGAVVPGAGVADLAVAKRLRCVRSDGLSVLF
jgi:hypothetical protein